MTWTFRALVGEGAFGGVYRAEHREGANRRFCAVKLWRYQGGAATPALRRFLLEGQVLCLLEHPAIVRATRVFKLPIGFCIALEWVRGVDLAKLSRGVRRVPPRVALEIAATVAAALEHAWDEEVDGRPLRLIHRDLKPANICLDNAGGVKVLDFGAVRVDLADNLADGTTVYGAPHTPGYSAPERFFRHDLRESDVYSLGATIAAICFGYRPQANVNNHEALHALLRGRLAPDADAEPRERALAAFLVRMCADRPEDRPSPTAVESEARALAEEVGGASLADWARHHVGDAIGGQHGKRDELCGKDYEEVAWDPAELMDAPEPEVVPDVEPDEDLEPDEPLEPDEDGVADRSAPRAEAGEEWLPTILVGEGEGSRPHDIQLLTVPGAASPAPTVPGRAPLFLDDDVMLGFTGRALHDSLPAGAAVGGRGAGPGKPVGAETAAAASDTRSAELEDGVMAGEVAGEGAASPGGRSPVEAAAPAGEPMVRDRGDLPVVASAIPGFDEPVDASTGGRWSRWLAVRSLWVGGLAVAAWMVGRPAERPEAPMAGQQVEPDDGDVSVVVVPPPRPAPVSGPTVEEQRAPTSNATPPPGPAAPPGANDEPPVRPGRPEKVSEKEPGAAPPGGKAPGGSAPARPAAVRVEVSAASRVKWVEVLGGAGGWARLPASLPPGTYKVQVDFADEVDSAGAQKLSRRLEVQPGGAIVLRCTEGPLVSCVW